MMSRFTLRLHSFHDSNAGSPCKSAARSNSSWARVGHDPGSLLTAIILGLWSKGVNESGYGADFMVSGFPLAGLLDVPRPGFGVCACNPNPVVRANLIVAYPVY